MDMHSIVPRLLLNKEPAIDIILVVIDAKGDVPGQLRKVNDNRLADLVIVCTGMLSAFNQALESVDRGGTVLFFASTEPEVDLPIPLSKFWRNGIKLMPSYGNSPLDAAIAIELLRTGRIPVKKMITHRLPLEETGKGFKLVAESDESMKVIIQPHKK